MKILYLSLSYVPSRRASSVQVMRMCEALALQGHDVVLVTKRCPERQEPEVGDDFRYYGVAPVFEIVKLPRPAWRGGGLVFTRHVFRMLRARRGGVDLVFGRDVQGACLAAWLGLPVLFEAHELPGSLPAAFAYRRLRRSPRLRRLVVISEALRADFDARGLLPETETVVAHDGAAPPAGTPDKPGADAGAADGRARIGYVGSFHRGKGVEQVVALARVLPEYRFDVVGGTAQALAAWRSKAKTDNVVFHGFVEPRRLPEYYRALDVALLPGQRQVYGATGRSDIGRWTSPLKLFEYMAAGLPIVASDLPVLREVLAHERNALLVPPDDLAAWKDAVERLVGDAELRRRLGQAAQRDVLEHYTWEVRAKKVLYGL